jgi:uncharacterized protein YecE (DUF72 family)
MKAQGPLERLRRDSRANTCISAHPTVEDATGETVNLVRQAVSEGRHAYVLVNNRSEGNAPLTVQALTEMLRK